MPMSNPEVQTLLTEAEAAIDLRDKELAKAKAELVLAELDSTQESAALSSARALKVLGRAASQMGNYEKALHHFHAALDLREQLKDEVEIASLYVYISQMHARRSDYTQGMEYATKGLNLAEAIGASAEIAVSLSSIGMIHFQLSNLDEALKFHTRALEIDEALDNQRAMAVDLGNIGIVYLGLSDYQKSREFYLKALSIVEEVGDQFRIAQLMGNLGLLCTYLSEYSQALEYYKRALAIHEDFEDKLMISYALGNVGTVYWHISDFAEALEYFSRALAIAKDVDSKAVISLWSGNIGNIYCELSDYTKAQEYCEQALAISKEIGLKSGLANWYGSLGTINSKLGNVDKAHEYTLLALSIDEEVGNLAGVALALGNLGSIEEERENYEAALGYFQKSYDLYTKLGRRAEEAEMLGSLGRIYARPEWSGTDENLAEQYLLQSVTLSKELGLKFYEANKALSELYRRQKRWMECHLQFEKFYELEKEVLNEKAQKAAANLEQKRLIAEREKEVEIAKASASAELSATTTLLHKVLPESIATRMIKGEKDIADYYPAVSILFADIAGFTPISADMPAIAVVQFLNYVFAEFDRIVKKHGCEKIKTIGDGYMAVCGAPDECTDHAERIAAAALEMQAPLHLPSSIREHLPEQANLSIRIGLHTGSIVAGVIGEERFVYDIYSDAVNTAARMESHGEASRIHCSSDFYRHLQNRMAMRKETPSRLSFVKRGEIEIKGKGMMRTYFLEESND